MLRILLALSELTLVFSSPLFSVVIYSEYTSSSMLSNLSESINLNSTQYINLMKYSAVSELDREGIIINCLFDYTYSVVYSQKLKQYSSLRGLPYFSPQNTSLGMYTFLLHPSPQTEAAAIYQYTKHLNWTSFHIFTSQKHDHKTIYEYLTKEDLYVISNTADQEVYDDFTGKIIKPSGNWKSVVITDGNGTSKHIQSLENLKIYKERCGYITNSQGSWGPIKEGGISVVEEGLEGASSEGEYEYKAIQRVLDMIGNYFNRPNTYMLRNDLILKFLNENTEDHVISKNFSIVNYIPHPNIVGTIYNNRILTNQEKTVFPGNVTLFNNSPPIIQISANLGLVEVDGSINPVNYYINLGVIPMIEIINADSTLLKNFKLDLHITDCGQTMFSYDHVSECMKKHYPYLGAFFINSLYEEIGEGYIQVFRENNIHIPQTAIFYNNWKYYDKDLFPELFITNAHQLYIHAILPYIINSFRWNQILVFFNDIESQEAIDAFLDNAEILKISVMNDKDHMIIPWSLNETEYKESVKSITQYLYDTDCRIYVLLLSSPYNVLFLEALYEFGFRNGDIVAINRSRIGNLIEIRESTGESVEKFMELADGSLNIYNLEYIGEYGKELQQSIGEMIKPEPTGFTCFQIDSLLLGAHTIDQMLLIGRDYEDPHDINYFMRQERFYGCSGIVSIDSQGNGRNEISFSIHNFYVQGEDWKEDVVGYYTIGITLPLNISRSIIWPGGAISVPNDMRIRPKCGFTPDQVRSNDLSSYLVLAMNVFYGISTCAFAIWIRKSLFSFEYEDLIEPKEMWFEDFVILVMPIVEALQFVALAEIRDTNPVLSYAGSLFVLDFDVIYDLNPGDFWTVMFVVLSLVTIWILCVFVFLTTLYKRFCKALRQFVSVVAYRLALLCSRAGFVPIVLTILKLFKCEEGIGGDLTDSFLHNDCETFCWKGLHLGVGIYGFVVVVLYSVLAITNGLLTEYLMDYGNVKTSSLFVLLKFVFQIILMVLNFHLKSKYPLLFSIVYALLFISWTLLVFKLNPYNYGRLNLWQKIIFIGLCLLFITVAIDKIFEETELNVWIWQLALSFLLLAVGIFIQYKHFPSMLYRRKPRNYDKLLRFAFRGDISAKELTEHELDYVYRSSSDSEVHLEIRTERIMPRLPIVTNRSMTNH